MKKIYILIWIFQITGLTFGQSNKSETFKQKEQTLKPFEIGLINSSTQNHLKSDKGPFNKKLDSILTEQFDSTKKIWTITGKKIYNYDTLNNNTDIISYWRQDKDSNWKGSEKEHFDYSSNNQMISDIEYYWDDISNQWIGDYRTDYSYDNAGIKTSKLNSNWWADSNSWVKAGKSDFSYDNNLNDTLDYYYSWDYINNIWVNNTKVINKYNSNKLYKSTTILYNTDSSKWINQFKSDLIYINGLLSQKLDSTWNKNAWTISNKTVYVCNVDGKPIYRNSYYWDIVGKIWIPSGIDTAVYSNHGDIIDYDSYQWDNVNKKWLYGYEKYKYQYDLTISSTSIITPIGYSSTNKIIGISQYGVDINGKPYETYRSTYFYSNIQTVSVPEIQNFGLITYPNPNNGSFTVSFSNPKNETVTIRLINVDGKIIGQYKCSDELFEFKEISIPSGVYLISIIGNSINKNGEIIIR